MAVKILKLTTRGIHAILVGCLNWFLSTLKSVVPLKAGNLSRSSQAQNQTGHILSGAILGMSLVNTSAPARAINMVVNASTNWKHITDVVVGERSRTDSIQTLSDRLPRNKMLWSVRSAKAKPDGRWS